MVDAHSARTAPLFHLWRDRIYLENITAAQSARIAFVLSDSAGQVPASLDPLAQLDKGCLVDYPVTNDPIKLLTAAAAWVKANPTARIVIFNTAHSALSSVQGKVGQRIVNSEVRFGNARSASGPVTGNATWRIDLSGSTMRVTADKGLWFDLTGSSAGFLADPDHWAPFPKDEPWVILPIVGERRAMWTVPVMLDAVLLERLNVGASYFVQRGDQYDRRLFPFFNLEGAAPERFLLELDCGDPYPASGPRTRLTPPPASLPSGLNDVHGRPVMLAPSGTRRTARGTFKLAMAPGLIQSNEVKELTHQFVPSGLFLAPGSKSLRLSMGSSNLETVALQGDAQGVPLDFGSGPALISQQDEFVDAADRFTTAWLNLPKVTRGGDAAIAMDPEGMQPYRPNATIDDGMDFAPSAIAIDDDIAIPFAPVLGVSSDAAITFDRKRLSKARRKKLIAHKVHVVDAASAETLRTPQGYLGTRNSNQFETLVFTRTSARNPVTAPVTADAGDFGLTPKNDVGRAILGELTARSKLCVVTRLDLLLNYFEEASLTQLYMADWCIQKGADGDQANFVILKHDPRPLYADDGSGLLQNGDQWTDLPGLALNATQVTAIRALVKVGIDSAQTDPLFAPFKKRMISANWDGLICLNMLLKEMPDQLGALEALCEDLTVHHIGVDLTAIQKVDEPVWKPGMFGLIYQESAGKFLPKDASKFPMQVQLKELKLLVENDAVRSFDCTVLGRPTQLFESDIKAGDADVTLKGKYQSRVTADGQRQDSYSFSVEHDFVYKFGNDYVLDSIAITRASLVTEIDPTDRKAKRGRLLLDGWLKFNKLGDVDLLGIKRLDFFDLGVAFGPKAGFKLNISYPNLRFDLDGFNGLSGVNPGSFLTKLPFKLSGFRIGDFALPKLGYFQFGDVPGIKNSTDKFKLALDFDLDLGSLGALAKKLDRFKLNFLVGWTPGSLKDMALGFKIATGGGGGSLDLGVEGIIQLSADHFHVGMNDKMLCLAADNPRLKVFSTPIPKSTTTTLAFYLLADPANPGKMLEKIGWYGVYNDAAPSGDGPVAIEHLALGQRIEIKPQGGPAIQDIRTTRQVISAISQLKPFKTDEEFLTFATKQLTYAPQRDWFVALAGKFFKIADIQLLLRDPDMYGVYAGFDLFFVDLLYQRLADGVGRYSGDLDIRKFVPQLDFGAFSVTMGIIGFEVYTDGGFLIDLGFPDHVDYSRSFVAQAGPFMGKGGFYVGRTPAAAIPQFEGLPAGDAFRMGVALRIGLGREFTKGPLFASLSVSVFARIEGAVARNTALVAPDAIDRKDLLAGYFFFLQGEIGIILEIEGRVDLRLVQARVLIRAWVAVGITLASRKPIILHAEAGIQVRVKFAIGRIKIFGKKITIYITLSYATTLRYEWELKGGPQMLALSDQRPSAWLAADELVIVATPLQLRLVLEISRRAKGDAVMVPMAMVNAPKKGDPNPLAPLATALLAWAAQGVTGAADPVLERFTVNGDAPTLARLTAKLQTFASLSDAELDIFLAKAIGGSTIELMTTDGAVVPPAEAEQRGYAFPLPPILALSIAGKPIDLATLPGVSVAAVEAIAQEISEQFARQSAGAAKRRAAGASRPLVAHLFRDWLQSLALNTLDALQNGWTTDPNDGNYAQTKMSRLLGAIVWDDVLGRTGRYLFGGIRIDANNRTKSTIALFDKAGLMLAVPAQDFAIELPSTSRGWLSTRAGTLTIDGKTAADVSNALPVISAQVMRPAATRQIARRFDLPDIVALNGNGLKTQLVRFTADLRGQLAVPQPSVAPALLARLALWGRAKDAQGQIDAQPQAMRYATIAELSVRLPEGAAKLAGGTAVIEVLGTGEAERRPLDALFPQGQADPVLSQAQIYLALNHGDKGFEIFQAAAGLAVARSTTVRERQPGDMLRALAGHSDDLFLAAASDLGDFVELLRRAAIVNATGTYLLLDQLADPVRAALAKPDAHIALILAYPAAVNGKLPTQAVNAAILDSALAADKRLVAMATGAPVDKAADRLFETVSLREPGSALIRFWRKPPLDAAAAGGGTAEAHLDALFDMLEFGVAGTGSAMAIDQSLPLASEYVSRDAPEAYTPEQHADFELPAGWDKGLRYDLLVPLYRWVKPARSKTSEINPYSALQQDKFTIDYGWRDMFGNRHGSSTSLVVEPAYEDALEPLGAWPGVGCTFAIGAKPNQFQLNLFDMPQAELSPAERRTLLLRVIHQLEAPYVEVHLESSFGKLELPLNFASQLTKALRAILDKGTAKQFTIKVTPFGTEKHPRLDLSLVVARTKGIATHCPDDVRTAVSPINLACRDKGSSDDADGTWLAREFRAGFKDYSLARGVDDAGMSRWWAVDRRLLPTRTPQAPDILAQPPLALAALAARNVDYTSFEKTAGGWQKVARTVDVPAVDSDAVFADLIGRMERFVGPGLAPMVTRQEVAFREVMQAKHELLKAGKDDEGLFKAVRGVAVAGPQDTSTAATAARRVLRMACGNDFRAFFEVSSVVVQPMDFSKTPKAWLGKGETAPKLFGRLTFAAKDGAVRSMTYGIPLAADGAIAIALFDDKTGKSSIEFGEPISFEVTHVEREVEEMPGGSYATPAASRWLTIIPFATEDDRRIIKVTDGALSVPTPIRILPKPPILANPKVARSERPAASGSYDDLIAAVCRWQYGFEISGLATDADEACCRLVYNVDPTASEILNTRTAAKPLFDGLAHQLARCQQAMTGIWDVLADPKNPQFAVACTVFAELVGDVAKVITTPSIRMANSAERAEDRFIIKRKSARLMTFRFADHIDDKAGFPIQLNDARADIGGAGWQPVNRNETSFALSSAHDGKALAVGTDGMQVQRLQSVWAAASIRRNAGLHPSFIYRTEELFVQEPLIPYLEERETIELKRQKPETLADRLQIALKPLFAAPTKRKLRAVDSPAQLRLAVESVRLFEKLNAFGHNPEPDPKVQLVTAGDESPQELAARLADLFAKRLAKEGLGVPGEARLILSVLMLTENRQPLLDIKRIAVPLAGLTI